MTLKQISNIIIFAITMGVCERIDRKQLFNLLTSMLGIYILYFIAGILHQSIVKIPHYNRFTHHYQICENTPGLILIPFAFAWFMGLIYTKIFIKQTTKIPHKNSALCGVAVVAATYFSILAIQKTSFPVVIMFQSCSILPVVFIGVFCSRVTDPNLKLGPKKIIVALIITAGILTFQLNDPQSKQRETKQQFIGIVFLLFHFVAEGFLPDLQAEIKINFKPEPVQMMRDINKWCTIITIIIAIVTLNLISFIEFLWSHIGFTIDLVLMSIVSGFGQFFVYKMIKQFKQHFVPFTISSRKILTAAISIGFYAHKTNVIQIIGISIVLFTVFVQFMIQITKNDANTGQSKTQNKDVIQLNQQVFEDNFRIQDNGYQNNHNQNSENEASDKKNSRIENSSNINDIKQSTNQNNDSLKDKCLKMEQKQNGQQKQGQDEFKNELKDVPIEIQKNQLQTKSQQLKKQQKNKQY